MRILLEPAFILHSRPYRDTSLLLDVFSQQYGRISLIAKGVRKPKSVRRAVLQPFTPIFISWTGRGDLKTLTDIELSDNPVLLRGDALFNGIYINELLVKLLYVGDPHPELFDIYKQAIQTLGITSQQQAALRYFEYQLLESLGYGLHIGELASSEGAIKPDQKFQYRPGHGFRACMSVDETVANPIVCGHCLSTLMRGELLDKDCQKSIKQLMRVCIHYLLDGRNLKSRELYKQALGSADG